MVALKIRMFGKFRMWHDDRSLDDGLTEKGQELLGYLLLHRDRACSRERIATQFWPDADEQQSRKAMRQLLWQIQTGLNLPDSPVLSIEPEWIGLDPRVEIDLDIKTFENAFDRVRDVTYDALDATSVAQLQEALHLYQADFLEGCYTDWCLLERERLQNIYLRMADKYMSYCEIMQCYEAGLACGAQVLRHDRAHERTHQHMMRLHYLAGDRVTALRQYAVCVASLKNELDVAPARSTDRLYQRIRHDAFGIGPSHQAQTEAQEIRDTAPMHYQLGAALAIAQDAFRQFIATLDQAQGQIRGFDQETLS